MKTRDKILATSLMLFNQEGEQNVTTVDIANEMDISPGNLYYHFKGKESIIDALFSRYESELTTLLQQSLEKTLGIEEHWLFIYVVFEEIHKFRFFYLNAGNIMLKYPDVERRFRRLIKTKITTIESLCSHLMNELAFDVDSVDIQLLAENIALSLLYWFPYQQLLRPDARGADLIHKGVYHVLGLVAPYAGERQQEYMSAIKLLYREALLASSP